MMETTPQAERTTIGTLCHSNRHTTHTLPSLTRCSPRAPHVCKPEPGMPPEDTCGCGEGQRRYQGAGRYATHVYCMHVGQGGAVSPAAVSGLGLTMAAGTGRRGPLQDLTCPGRTEVVKSMPTNELWSHPVSCLGHSPWEIWSFSKIVVVPEAAQRSLKMMLVPSGTCLDCLSPSIPS